MKKIGIRRCEVEFINSFDWGIMNFIQESVRCAFLDVVMTWITFLGDEGIIWIIAGVALRITEKYRKYGVVLLLGLLMGSIIGNNIIKPIVERARPCTVDPSVQLLIDRPSSFSFPSGHTTSSFVGATVLMKANRKFGIPAVIVAALIAFSRMYLYVHFPTDILGGIVLGVAIGLVGVAIANKVKLPQKKK